MAMSSCFPNIKANRSVGKENENEQQERLSLRGSFYIMLVVQRTLLEHSLLGRSASRISIRGHHH